MKQGIVAAWWVGVALVGVAGVARAGGPATRPALGWKGLDVQGRVCEVGAAGRRGVAVVFLSVECPISNRYVPALNEVAKEGERAGVQVVGVISDEGTTWKQAAGWGKQYGVEFPVVFDASGEWARRLSPGRTPEAFVLGSDGEVRYRGRIDDGWATVGRKREVVSAHELLDAIDAVGAGKEVKVARTEAVGCAYEGWTEKRAVTWARDVAPIVYANCAECHREGEVAPFPLVSYGDVRKRAKQVNEVVSEGVMPPWKPAAGYGCFVGERRLSEGQKSVIAEWVKGGAAEGDEAEAPGVPGFGKGWRLGEPDVVVRMPEAFDVPPGGGDVYRAFVVPVELKQDEMIVGMEFRAGNPKVVHHCLLFTDESGKARKLDEADPAPGWRGFGGVGFTPSSGLGGWAPGGMAERLPEGMGRPIRKGADVVFQMHYHPDGKAEKDQSELALYFAKRPVTKVVASVPIGRRDIHIPAGEAHYVRRQEVTLAEEMTVVGIIPHMHLLGREMKVTATEPGGRVVPLVWIPDWDFQWQGQYRYAEPVVLPAGTKIEMEAVYDNSEGNPSNPNRPAKEVRFGEQTTDEMCYCFLEVAGDAGAVKRLRREVVTQQVMRGMLKR